MEIWDEYDSGAIVVGSGLPAAVRIPVPGLMPGLALQFKAPGALPGGNSSAIVLSTPDVRNGQVQYKTNGNLCLKSLRLDLGEYAPHGAQQTIGYHWNRHRLFKEADWGVRNHQPAGRSGAVLYEGARAYAVGGRLILVVGLLVDVVSIVVASDRPRRVAEVAGGWAGAVVGCRRGAPIGGYALGLLAAPTGIAVGPLAAAGAAVGCAVGAGVGYWVGSGVTGTVYQWATSTVFVPATPVDATRWLEANA